MVYLHRNPGPYRYLILNYFSLLFITAVVVSNRIFSCSVAKISLHRGKLLIKELLNGRLAFTNNSKEKKTQNQTKQNPETKDKIVQIGYTVSCRVTSRLSIKICQNMSPKEMAEHSVLVFRGLKFGS